MIDRPTLTEQVRQQIAADGRSINRLAADAGLPQSTVHKFATGQRDMTSEPLGRLIAALGGELKWKRPRRVTANG